MLRGCALICGATPWGWLQKNDGKCLSDFPFARFCDYIGVKLTDNCIDCPDPIPFRSDLVAFQNVSHAVQSLAMDPHSIEYVDIITWAVKELGDTLPGVPIETLQNIVMNAGHEVIPASDCPIQDKSCRERSKCVCSILCALPGVKAPGK